MSNGGAVAHDSSLSWISNSTFTQNYATFGGALYPSLPPMWYVPTRCRRLPPPLLLPPSARSFTLWIAGMGTATILFCLTQIDQWIRWVALQQYEMCSSWPMLPSLLEVLFLLLQVPPPSSLSPFHSLICSSLFTLLTPLNIDKLVDSHAMVQYSTFTSNSAYLQLCESRVKGRRYENKIWL